MVARRLAQCSGTKTNHYSIYQWNFYNNISITIKGMDYAIMSGGDVGPLGEDAVNQLHGLFKWAASSKKG